jgi:hypothetical protein
MLNFNELGLSPVTLAALAAKGFEVPTPIQRVAIPALLQGTKDIIAQAQTGTGKTAAFGLPIMEQIEDKGKVQALILTPTRELALQVCDELTSLKGKRSVNMASIYGGASVVEQLRRLKKGVDIVVGTPGRTLDHIRRKSLNISELRWFILDEADEMLNMGFIEDIEKIFGETPETRRVMLFSATMPDRIVKLSKKYMHDTEILKTETTQATAQLTDQIYFEVSESDRFDALTRIIDVEPDFYGVVFCRTKLQVDEVVSNLHKRGYEADGLHGDIAQATMMRLANWGCELAYYKRTPLIGDEELRLKVHYEPLASLLATCNIISIHVPVTESTHNMVNAEFLAKMRADAILINTARGEIVDQVALADALVSGRIAACGLDTISPEPVTVDNNLLNLPNSASQRIVFSPHIGGITEGTFYRCHRIVWSNIARIIAKEQPINIVS